MTDLKIGCRYFLDGTMELDGRKLKGPEVIYWARDRGRILVDFVNVRPAWIPERLADGEPSLIEHPGN